VKAEKLKEQIMRAKIFSSLLIATTIAISSPAKPVRVVILDFEDNSGMVSDKQLGGTINTKSLAKKGADLMMEQLVGTANFDIVDQRDFMKQMGKRQMEDEGKRTSLKPAYLDAARALNADVLLRGSMMSFSTGKQKVNQGGYQATMAKVSLSVAVQAQDVAGGSVIAMATGHASQTFRQTDAVQTELSEDDVLSLMEKALEDAMPKVTKRINARLKELAARAKLKLNFKTTDDPAMLEIDGVLVGSTPIENLEVYQGEHLLHVSRPGYESITKRVNLTKDATISVPMLRTDLTADERKEILKSADLRAYLMDGKPDMIIQEID
jgi:hypothetical protein